MKKILYLPLIMLVYFTLIACSVNTQTVTITITDDKTIHEIKVQAEQEKNDFEIPDKEGHILIGFYYDKDHNNPIVFPVIFESDITIYVKWEVKTFSITWKDEETILKIDEGVAWNTLPEFDGETPIKEGYTFTGWTPKVEVATKNQTYIAEYTKDAPQGTNKYTIRFYDYDDTLLKEEIIEEGTKPIPPLNPNNKEGYHFVSWDKEFDNITGDLVIKAQYQINQYTIKWVNYDGSILDEEQYSYGETLSYKKSLPVKIADDQYEYIFDGWSSNDLVATKNLEITAVYQKELIKYQVKFVSARGDVIDIVNAEYNDELIIDIEDPTYGGYLFAGWILDNEIIANKILVKGNTTILASFFGETNQYYYRISYNSDFDLPTADIVGVKEGIDPTEFTNPDQINYYIITGILNRAFYKCLSLTKVVLPESVTNIGDDAFFGCIGLEEILLTENVTRIGANAFGDCDNLTIQTTYSKKPEGWSDLWNSSNLPVEWDYFKVEVVNNVIYWLLRDNTAAVAGVLAGKYPTEITIETEINGHLVNKIISGAFEGQYNLKSLTIPEGVKYIEEFALNKCYYVTIFTSLLSAPSGWQLNWNDERPIVWDYYKTIQADDFIYHLKNDGTAALSSVKEDVSFVNIIMKDEVEGYLVTEILTEAFDGQYELESIILSSNLTKIGVRAFFKCSNIIEINLPQGLVSIDNYAFEACFNLETITIPNSVTNVGYNILPGCPNVSIYTTHISKPIGWNDNWNYEGRPVAWNYLKTETIDDIVYWLSKDNTATVVGLKEGSSLTELHIKDEIDGHLVTRIAARAFEYQNKIELVVIPVGVTEIGEYAFLGCSELASINMVEGIRTIGEYAFGYCFVLTEITIPETVMTIGKGAFSNCHSLTSINIPEGILTIGEHTFSGCRALREIIVAESITSIGEFAFFGCSNLESIVIPEGVTSIGAYAFRDCSSLKEIIIPDNITRINEATFSGCINLESVVISENVIRIEEYAFYDCSSLLEVTIAETVTFIGQYAFTNCSSLSIYTTLLERPNTWSYFWNQHGATVFWDHYLTAVIDDVIYEYQLGKTARVVGVTEEGYITQLSVRSKIEGCPVTRIEPYAFSGQNYLETAYIPNSVTFIGEYAFWYCTSLKAIRLSENLTSIEERVFTNCSLSEINIPSAVTSIGYEAFLQCHGLTLVNISDGVVSIGQGAFAYTSIRNIYIPDSVISMGASTFSMCTKLSSVRLSENLSQISDRMFYYCSSLTTIVIPEGVVSIGSEAFSNCKGLISVVIPESINKISRNAFFGPNKVILYTQLTSKPVDWEIVEVRVAWDYYMTVVEDGVIYYLQNGKTAIVGGNALDINPNEIVIKSKVNNYPVTTIMESAFSGERNLTTIVIPNSITSIGASAFYWCDNLEEIVIPSSVVTMGSNVFGACEKLTINTSLSEKPEGWDIYWNGQRPVAWDYYKTVIVNDVIYRLKDDNTASVGGIVSGSVLTEITIENEVEGYLVTEILNKAFANQNNLISINIPETIHTIYPAAFENCTNLISIAIPDSVTSVGYSAFLGCENLVEVTLSNSLSKIENLMFYGCSNLTSITIPDSIISIGSAAFYMCYQLGEVNLPNSLTKIEEGAFSECSNLTNILIPTSVIEMGEYVFSVFHSMMIHTLFTSKPSGWQANWNGYAQVIWGCDRTEVIDDIMYHFRFDGLVIVGGPNKGANLVDVTIESELEGRAVVEIKEQAFAGCVSLTTITIPDSIIKIGDSAFSGCYNLVSISTLKNIVSIGSSAFSSCSKLETVFIPLNVVTIGDYAFSNCLEIFIYTEHQFKPDGWSDTWNNYGTIGRPVIWDYKDTVISNDIIYYIQNGKTAVVGGLTTDNSLTEVTINNSIEGNVVTQILNYAFDNLVNLTKVNMPSSLIKIGDGAFSRCTNLTNVIIPDSVVSIGSSAFSGCIGLNEITIPNGIDELSNAILSGCSGLVTVKLPDKLTRIGDSAFSYCKSLMTLNIPNTVTKIGAYAFFECSGLTEIVIPHLVTQIETSLFSGCSSLTKMVIPDSVVQIGSSAFLRCNNLTSITIPEGLKSIGYSAFRDCSKLVVIEIPGSVESVGQSVFDGCDQIIIYSSGYNGQFGWHYNWNSNGRPVYWLGQWFYDSNGIPTPY